MTGNVMRFQNPDNVGSTAYNKFILSNATPDLQIWDITNHIRINRINTETNGSTLSFYDSNQIDKVYLAINPTAAASFPKPEVVGSVPTQDLHGMLPADMLIITHPNFYHKQKIEMKHNAREK